MTSINKKNQRTNLYGKPINQLTNKTSTHFLFILFVLLSCLFSAAFACAATSSIPAATLKGVSITDFASKNIPPQAVIKYTENNNTVNFDAGTSNDSDGSIAEYKWDFGDGASGTGVTVSHVYSGEGNYPVTLSVIDDKGGVSIVQTNVVLQSSVMISNLSPATYKVSTLNIGDTTYVDRSYTITGMSDELKGLEGIKTLNDDKQNNSSAFISFDINQKATLYIAYDSRATVYPSWLTKDFARTSLSIETTDTNLSHFSIWKKTVLSGTVSLPGNMNGSPSGVKTNYFILVKLLPSVMISNILPANYKISTLNIGDTTYVDRSYVITGMSDELKGLKGIKTVNDDKQNNSSAFVSFDVNQKATLYIAYDSRATVYPSWLTKDFIRTSLSIETTDTALSHFSIWKKSVLSGAVSLPGNMNGSPSGVKTNYFVLVK
ncbi:MAG TPA: PKD domain-containing protein [Gammaproteobacteria bacterium]|nr:PKD domain-containing protein [Gammaproteobacteria bacterium]